MYVMIYLYQQCVHLWNEYFNIYANHKQKEVGYMSYRQKKVGMGGAIMVENIAIIVNKEKDLKMSKSIAKMKSNLELDIKSLYYYRKT